MAARRVTAFARLIAAAAIAVCAQAGAQSVVNTLSRAAPPPRPAQPEPIPLSEYHPLNPPAADVPTVISPKQDEIGVALEQHVGETNDQYTQRMKIRYEAARKDLDRVLAEHQARMRALVQPNHR